MQPLEPLFPLAKAVERATGHRPHLSTILRWCGRGVRGTVLESWMVGGRRLTSVEAVNRFVSRRSETASTGGPTADANRRVRAAHKAALKELESEGI